MVIPIANVDTAVELSIKFQPFVFGNVSVHKISKDSQLGHVWLVAMLEFKKSVEARKRYNYGFVTSM